MNEPIQRQLETIERQEHVRILYACESGSRAWGFASADSDWDVRFIYVRPVEAYLTLHRPRDVIEIPIEDDLDINGWDLFKACDLLRKMNPPLLEWLGSPIVYRETGPTARTLRELAAKHLNLRAYGEHYLSMAKGNMNDSIDGKSMVRQKKYLYALRPLICLEWLLEKNSFPPTLFQDVMAGLSMDAALRDAILELIDTKRSESERKEIAPIKVFDDYIRRHLEQTPEVLKDIAGSAFPMEGLDHLLHDAIMT